jgi:hypothetical protein
LKYWNLVLIVGIMTERYEMDSLIWMDYRLNWINLAKSVD